MSMTWRRVLFGSPLPTAVARERVAKVLATGKPMVTDLILGPLTKNLLTTIYVPAKVPGWTLSQVP